MTDTNTENSFKLAEAHFRAKRFGDAIRECEAALRVDPKHGMSLHLLGILKRETGKSAEAIEIFKRALLVRPQDPACWNAFAVALRDEDRWEESIAAAAKSIEIERQYLAPYNTLATALWNARRWQDAIAVVRHALKIKPDFAEAHLNLSGFALALGDFEPGWEEFEWRLRTIIQDPLPELPQPEWNGSDISGKTILLRPEQGLGDSIQFVRYAKLIAERGAKVILECPPELTELMRSAPGVSETVAETPTAFDVHLTLMSAARIFKTRLENIPADVPYLSAPAGQIDVWRTRVAQVARPGKMKVGLVWAGNPRHGNDRRRSLRPGVLTPLRAASVDWFSLQKPAASPGFSVHDFTNELKDFQETAALVSQLDLVIAADTSVAHLAGALGKPTWVMIPALSDWRWLIDREDSPWYPTMRLFRQKKSGDWGEVIARVATELHRLTS